MNVLPLHKTALSSPKKRPSSRKQIPGLDAVRAFAALGVILLHSCVPYLQHPMPGLAWPIRDSSSSTVDVVFWSIELFIMPLFLVVAGFFAWRTLQSRDEVALIKSRAKRLLRPLLFGILVILPMDLYAWVLGWVTEGIVAPVKLKSLKFAGSVDQNLWGLSHLWFLQYLFLYVLAVGAFARLRKRFNSLSLSLNPGTLVASGLLIGTVTLYLHPEVVWGFQHAFLPFSSKWVYSGLFFLLGATLAVHDAELDWLRANANRMIAPAAICALAALVLGRWHLAGGDNRLAEGTLAGLTCLSGGMVSMSLIGVAVSRIHKTPLAIEYLAAASFWVYLVHHPVLGLVHTDLKWLFPQMAPLTKTALAFTLSTLVSLLSYEAFVRCTGLGRWLGFNWQPVQKMEDQNAVLPMTPAANYELPSTKQRRAA